MFAFQRLEESLHRTSEEAQRTPDRHRFAVVDQQRHLHRRSPRLYRDDVHVHATFLDHELVGGQSLDGCAVLVGDAGKQLAS